MLVRTWALDSVTILDLHGPLTAESGAAIQDAIATALAAGRVDLVVNLLGVDLVDAAGIGLLAEAVRMVGVAGGTLRLVLRCETTRELLIRTGLTGLVPMFRTEAEALASVEPALR